MVPTVSGLWRFHCTYGLSNWLKHSTVSNPAVCHEKVVNKRSSLLAQACPMMTNHRTSMTVAIPNQVKVGLSCTRPYPFMRVGSDTTMCDKVDSTSQVLWSIALNYEAMLETLHEIVSRSDGNIWSSCQSWRYSWEYTKSWCTLGVMLGKNFCDSLRHTNNQEQPLSMVGRTVFDPSHTPRRGHTLRRVDRDPTTT